MSRGASAIATAVPEPRESTDGQLVAATRRGDDAPVEQLYARYQGSIAGYVQKMVKDHARAEDITQDIFISALRRMRETDRPIAFKPWVYEIARNACIDQFRRSQRGEEVSYDAADGLPAADNLQLVTRDASPDDAFDAKQRLDHLCGAFGGLSETHHQILVLRDFEGLSYREIGERLGTSRAAVERTLLRARRRLTGENAGLVTGPPHAPAQGTSPNGPAAAATSTDPSAGGRSATARGTGPSQRGSSTGHGAAAHGGAATSGSGGSSATGTPRVDIPGTTGASAPSAPSLPNVQAPRVPSGSGTSAPNSGSLSPPNIEVKAPTGAPSVPSTPSLPSTPSTPSAPSAPKSVGGLLP